MFCSATPALMNWSGQRADELLDDAEPDVPGDQHDVPVRRGRGDQLGEEPGPHRPPHLGQRAGQLRVVRRPVVPEHLVLHERDALALDRVREHAARPVRRPPARHRHGPAELLVVVAVDLGHVPAEGPPLVGEGLQGEGLLGGGQRLELVVVDDGDQIGQPVVGREHGRLPHAALVALAVAEQHVGAPRLVGVPGPPGQPGADRQAVAERAGGQLDAGDADVADVPGEERAVAVVLGQQRRVEEAALGEHGVQGGAGVALAHDEAVPVRPVRALRVDLQHPA